MVQFSFTKGSIISIYRALGMCVHVHARISRVCYTYFSNAKGSEKIRIFCVVNFCLLDDHRKANISGILF